MTYDVIVVGAGPAGMNAAIYANRAGLNVLMLEKGAPGGQMVNTAEVENYIGLSRLSGADLSLKMFNHTQELGVEYGYGDVTGIVDGNPKKVITMDAEYLGKTVIIATGTSPRPLGAINEDRFSGNGISWCAICDGAFFKDLDIVVVGGGNSAIEEATYLTKIVNHITVVNILPTLQADAKAIDQAKATGKMDFKLGYEILSFDGENKLESVKIRNAETKEEEDIKVDGAFVFIGSLPETTLVKDLGITNKWGYIKVDDKMRTTIPGIFGIGDVIEKDLRQIITAAADGTIAAVEVSRYIESLDK